MGNRQQNFWEAVAQDLSDFPDLGLLAHVALRLLFAAVLGGILGYEREKIGKAAGLRTHMLVSLGAAFFVMVPLLEGMTVADMSRVVQGVVTGIGFLGAGAIIKMTETGRIEGMTTAAGIWLTAAIGVAVGFGRLGAAVVATAFAFVILGILHRLDRVIGDGNA